MDFNEIINDFKTIKTHKWHRVWKPFMEKYKCNYICELGVYKGENFLQMINHNPMLAVAVDSYVDDGFESRNDAHYTQVELDSQYKYFINSVKGRSCVKIIKDYTFNAVKKFENNYFDFVYIDADHSTEGCLRDITDWYPKVKAGKFLVGHDYKRGFGVVDAVNKFIKDNNLELIRFATSNWAIVKK